MKTESYAAFHLREVFSGIFVLFMLYLASLHGYLFFHSIAEMLSVMLSCSIFVVVWNSKEFIENNYIIFIGIACIFTGGLDMLHALSCGGMGIFKDSGPNLSFQLWTAARYVESISLLIAPLLLNRKFNANQIVYIYLLFSIILLASIFYRAVFPNCFVDGVGLTLFAIISKYIICFILLAALYLLFQKKRNFETSIFRLFCISIVSAIASELLFTAFFNVNGFSDFVDHILKIISFYLIYKAVTAVGFKIPRNLMLKKMSEKEKQEKLISNISDVIAIVDHNMIITYGSSNISKQFGWKPHELIGKNILFTVHPDDREKIKKNFALILEKEKENADATVEFRLLCGDGGFKSVELTAVNMVNDPIVKGVLASFRDITRRLESKEKLLKSEEKFKLIFNTTPDAINLNSVEDGVYIDVNEGFTKIMGYSLEDVVGKSALELNIWNDVKDRNRLVSGLEQHGLVDNFEADFRTKDGQIRTGLMSARLITINNKKVVLFITRDITEKKQVEKKLQNSEKRYRQLVENIAEHVWEMNKNGIFTQINSKAINAYGVPAEQMIGKTPFDFMPDKEAKRMVAMWKKIIDAGKPFKKLENIIQNVDGRLIHIETSGFPFFDDGGKLLGYRGITIDITERIQNERDIQALMESSVGILGQELFDTVAVKLCEWLDCDCAIIGEIVNGDTVKALSMVLDGKYLSKYSCPLAKSPCGEIVQKHYCVYPENVQALFPDDPELIKMKASGYIGISLEDRDGKTTGVLCCISRKRLHITEKTRNVMKIIGSRVSAEIERKKIEAEMDLLERKLRQSQKMEAIGTLAGGIAHDFNNILFPILGYAEMLLAKTPEDSPFRKPLSRIYTGSIRARDLVKQILTFARQDTSESSELKLMKIQPVIKEAIKLIRSTIPTTIEIQQEISPDCGAVKADPTQIHQIIMNLATNAYHAMADAGGQLTITLKEINSDESDLNELDILPGSYACLTVADTGLGMNKEIINKIFDPFFTTKEKGKGTGMGLSVVHGIVKSMKGAIQVSSKPGKGSEFHVYLPIIKSDYESDYEKQPVPSMGSVRGGIEHVLLVDDEETVLIMATQMLKYLGYQVTSRNSSIDALEAFRFKPDQFDLVITDMAMPNMSGDKLAIELIKIRPDIPILLCTGFSETMSETNAASLGIKSFLLKPIVINDLARKIREVLDNPA